MKSFSIFTLGLVMCCVLVLSGADTGRTAGASRAANAPPCFSTHTRGAGWAFIRTCISDRGNVVQFEFPEYTHHLNGGEGYVVCTGGITPHGYDAGIAQNGFQDPVITQPNGPNTFPLTVVRTTTDGIFKLAQSFGLDARHELTITMTLTNLSDAKQTEVVLQRYYDGNVEGTNLNRWGTTIDSVWAWTTLFGVMLTGTTFGVNHPAGVETFETWDPFGAYGAARGCSSAGIRTPTPRGDYVGRMSYLLDDIGPGAHKTVKFVYRRF